MKKKFKHKKLVIVLVIIVAAIIVLVGVAKRKLNSVAEATKIVQLEKVDKRDLSDYISDRNGKWRDEDQLFFYSCDRDQNCKCSGWRCCKRRRCDRDSG